MMKNIWASPSLTRIIDGKKFKYNGTADKITAEDVKRKWKEAGHSARIFPVPDKLQKQWKFENLQYRIYTREIPKRELTRKSRGRP